jgi:ATP-dependent Clp protease protease subunit
MPYPNEHAARIKDPGDFIQDTIRRKNIADGVDIINGKTSKDGSMETQAYRLSSEKFTEKEAKKWLKDNNVDYIFFEPSINSKAEMKNATLKIYGAIGESLPDYIEDLTVEVPNTSAKMVSDFLEENEDVEQITVRINSPGGDVQEGWAIHDLLVNSGKKIKTIGESKIYSIATIVFLSGSEREIMKNADGLIHNPFIPPHTMAGKYESGDLIKIAEDLKQEEEKILEFYSERTGTQKDKLAEYMKNETKLSAEDMLNLGFATKIIEPVTAYAFLKLKNNVKMDEKAFFEKLGSTLDNAILKMKNFSRIAPANIMLTDKDGKEITIEKESGTPAVGDKATPDGTFSMSDGSVIVIADGLITDIKPKSDDKSELEKANAKIAELETKVSDLEKEKTVIAEAAAKVEADKATVQGLITELSAIKNQWKPEARTKNMGHVDPPVGINLDRVKELRDKLNNQKSE